MTGVRFITTEDARHGFSLAGTIQQTCALDKAEETLCQAMADPDVGVMVIDERLVRAISEPRFAELEDKWNGVLVTLPAPERIADEEDHLHRLIRRALGYHVRLQI
ncbi:MAG TPA: V-type ATP synthase subunit F [Geopsychrobacteraceae bacterium]|nr:V-type ATP synthase subunit F [Geopsychrobacteraceae bacterium]